MAEGLFRRLIGNRKDVTVTSAGVHAVRGQPPSLYGVQVLQASRSKRSRHTDGYSPGK
jgi:protein-tyrosine-phosphatase